MKALAATAAILALALVGCARADTAPAPSEVAVDASVGLDIQAADAIVAGDLTLVQALLEAGLDPEVDLGGGVTPLHKAAASDQAAIAATLLHAGADPDAQADSGQTPLMLAASVDAGAETVVALLDGGADPLVHNPTLEGMTALHYAAWRGSVHALAALLDAGVDIDLVDGRETTAIMYTTFLGQPEAAALLISRGCDLNHRDNDGKTALFWARYHDFPAIAQAIEDAGGVE